MSKFNVGDKVRLDPGWGSVFADLEAEVVSVKYHPYGSDHGVKLLSRQSADAKFVFNFKSDGPYYFSENELVLLEAAVSEKTAPEFQVGDVVEFVEDLVVTGHDGYLVNLKIPGLGVVEKRSVLPSRLKLVSRPEKEIPLGTVAELDGEKYVLLRRDGDLLWQMLDNVNNAFFSFTKFDSACGVKLQKIARESL